jgi:oxygen-independent coproporphyrinogen-3 oxidase
MANHSRESEKKHHAVRRGGNSKAAAFTPAVKSQTQIPGLYIHVPFCVRKCLYCDFVSVPIEKNLVEKYLSALEKEVKLRCRNLRPVTIYIGGGTPTALPEKDLQTLLRIITANLNLSQITEFTVEANPGTLSQKKVKILKNAGVNRVSVGAQSFNNSALKTLGRIHTPQQTVQSVEILRKSDFQNINLDLIFSVPGTTPKLWEKDLQCAVSLKPRHISTYCLTYEKGTVLAQKSRTGSIDPVPEKEEAAMYKTAIKILSDAGYRQYEISNFAIPSFECRHNLDTWNYREYIGLGPGAVSFIAGRRMRNGSDILKYCELTENRGSAATRSEHLTGKRKAGEVVMLALRTISGITESEFAQRTGLSLTAEFAKEIKDLSEQKLVSFSRGRLRLTKRALLFADSVLALFI